MKNLHLYHFQEKQVELRRNEELLQSFKEQAADSAAKVCTDDANNSLVHKHPQQQLQLPIRLHTQVCELQSSLSACRKEMNSYLQQIEEMKKNYETELQQKKDKV